ncbi:MAG TPA: DNA double-strand break repair nuclease NurA [Streptosporangiaceae bacterium]
MTTAREAASAARAVSFSVDPWDPSYGQAVEDGAAMTESTAELNLDLERPSASWAPVDPDLTAPLPGTVLILDGVRRIDARVWVHGGGPQPAAGIAASLAAGVVRCTSPGGRPSGTPRSDGVATLTDVAVERGLFTAAPRAADIATRFAVYHARAAAGPGPEQLSLALQQRLSDAEVRLATAVRARHADEDDLLVVDGPLRGRTHLDRTVGYVKTHHASYLPDRQAAVVAELVPGQRTPAFTMGTSWRRHSWYLRLPGSAPVPWSGIVRLECSADWPAAAVTAVADLTARLLPPLASAPHKDPRAPQNLVPIGGLERELRRRLGDQQLLYRSLRAAAMGG